MLRADDGSYNIRAEVWKQMRQCVKMKKYYQA